MATEIDQLTAAAGFLRLRTTRNATFSITFRFVFSNPIYANRNYEISTRNLNSTTPVQLMAYIDEKCKEEQAPGRGLWSYITTRMQTGRASIESTIGNNDERDVYLSVPRTMSRFETVQDMRHADLGLEDLNVTIKLIPMASMPSNPQARPWPYWFKWIATFQARQESPWPVTYLYFQQLDVRSSTSTVVEIPIRYLSENQRIQCSDRAREINRGEANWTRLRPAMYGTPRKLSPRDGSLNGPDVQTATTLGFTQRCLDIPIRPTMTFQPFTEKLRPKVAPKGKIYLTITMATHLHRIGASVLVPVNVLVPLEGSTEHGVHDIRMSLTKHLKDTAEATNHTGTLRLFKKNRIDDRGYLGEWHIDLWIMPQRGDRIGKLYLMDEEDTVNMFFDSAMINQGVWRMYMEAHLVPNIGEHSADECGEKRKRRANDVGWDDRMRRGRYSKEDGQQDVPPSDLPLLAVIADFSRAWEQSKGHFAKEKVQEERKQSTSSDITTSDATNSKHSEGDMEVDSVREKSDEEL